MPDNRLVSIKYMSRGEAGLQKILENTRERIGLKRSKMRDPVGDRGVLVS